MSYEEQEYLNDLTRPARERHCRRAWMVDQAVRWGGWILAGLILLADLAVRVC